MELPTHSLDTSVQIAWFIFRILLVADPSCATERMIYLRPLRHLRSNPVERLDVHVLSVTVILRRGIA